MVPLLALFVAAALLSSCDGGKAAETSRPPPSAEDSLDATADTVAAPVFSPAGGRYATNQSVAIRTATDGATIHYTSDGSVPTARSPRYESPLQVMTSKILRAIAVKRGMRTSPVTSATFAIVSMISIPAVPWNEAILYGRLTYVGQTYRTVKIGTQTWMAENLNVKAPGKDTGMWFGNDADTGAKYGRLYTWSAAMRLPPSCDSASCLELVSWTHQGICPDGWHIPGITDWQLLGIGVGSHDSGSMKLRSVSGWDHLWAGSGPGYGTDDFGFRVLPAGSGKSVGCFAFFWSSLESDEFEEFAWGSPFTCSEGMRYYDYRPKANYNSVRCIQDQP